MDGDANNRSEPTSPVAHYELEDSSNAELSAPGAAPAPNPYAAGVENVTASEIGVQTLLNRLKQSIASAKEFASFLKKRSGLEEEKANGLKKVCKATAENLRKYEHRQGSFGKAYDEITRIHEQMADNGLNFASSLHQMHDDLMELAANMERGRKHWKTTGLNAEQRLQDTEAAMRKSKAKYDSVADDYDRARTGGQSGRVFGIKGPKSAAQHEEDLHRKVVAADADYAQKVQSAQTCRSELLSRGRPEAIKNLLDLMRECDAALTLQMQKFASFNEKLLLSNGTCVSPMKGADGQPSGRSLRDSISAVNNEQDMNSYVASFSAKVPPKPAEIRYERNAVLAPVSSAQPASTRQPEPVQTFNSRQGPSAPQLHSPTSAGSTNYNNAVPSPVTTQPISFSNLPGAQKPANPIQDASSASSRQADSRFGQPHERSISMGQTAQVPSQYNNSSVGHNGPSQPSHYNSASVSSAGPPQLSTLPFQSSGAPGPSMHQPNTNHQATQPLSNTANLPPVRPVFGMTLEQLFERDGSAVPMVVHQCIQAVDLFGLEVEGIYRLSGTNSHINKIKALFDNDASKVDFRNPEAFFQDVNSVAGLLKQFFRDMPDPLLTREHYQGFIDAAKHDDPTIRRDSLHAIINALPDPNYATLRALTLHLNRVQENSASNRMNASNLAIVFGPTLMGANTGPNIQDAGWQVRVIDTILCNTYQIFDDD